jgi:hypothetical protein
MLRLTSEGSGSQNQTKQSSSEELVLLRSFIFAASVSEGVVTACARAALQGFELQNRGHQRGARLTFTAFASEDRVTACAQGRG